MRAVGSFTHDRPGSGCFAWRTQDAWRELDELETSGWHRAVVVAAHPDDETLGAGGLVARLVGAGTPVDGVVLTRGEGSHPHSPTVTSEDLAARRTTESRAAWDALGADAARLRVLELPDGGLEDRVDEITARIVETVTAGACADPGDAALLGRCVVVAPFAADGHPDHEAAALAAARAARRTGADLLEFPIWWWQWADPQAGFPTGFVRMTLSEQELARKSRAVHCHRTQVEALSSAPGDEVMLGRHVLEHALADEEAFRLTAAGDAAPDSALDDLHRLHEEPWGVDTSWYEIRKRGLLLSMLPRRRYRHGVEVGCSTGALSAALAHRCDALSVIDASPHALAAAERRLLGSGATASVEALLGSAPATWPTDPVDLVVISEVGYFLSPQQLRSLVERLVVERLVAERERQRDAGGLTILLAHWRHPIDGWPMDAADVHAAFTGHPQLPPTVAEYRDTDVEVLVLADSGWWDS
ncbi:PIG-L family deacetylase [Nocardioidaceae bacterium]|nr:PIG-L family deacetylase [Nocardioidaceae bacterium]